MLIVGFFTGCNQSATSVFKKDPIYAQNLQYTKIGKLIVGDNVKALINITYLNSVDSSKWNNGKQNFLVGEYYTDGKDDGYTLKMNEQTLIDINEVFKSDEIYKNIAFRNNWATYSVVSYDDTDSTTLTLIYSDFQNNKTSLSFIKE